MDLPIGMALPIVAGPTYLPIPRAWEVTVALPVYSSKLACKAFNRLPDSIDVAGHTYLKHGFHGADCTAWYRRKGP
jgi:hypothetical protein